MIGSSLLGLIVDLHKVVKLVEKLLAITMYLCVGLTHGFVKGLMSVDVGFCKSYYSIIKLNVLQMKIRHA